MNEEPGKRPSFDMIIPILEKMKKQVLLYTNTEALSQ